MQIIRTNKYKDSTPFYKLSDGDIFLMWKENYFKSTISEKEKCICFMKIKPVNLVVDNVIRESHMDIRNVINLNTMELVYFTDQTSCIKLDCKLVIEE